MEAGSLAGLRGGQPHRAGFDISVQTYRSDCPPVALTKLPLTVCPKVVDFVVGRMQQALETLDHDDP